MSRQATAERAGRARDARSPRRRLPAGERRLLILDAAYAAFVERGYDAVSMREIAAAAGVTKPVVYRHFESKDGLCAACVERFAEPMLRQVEQATSAAASADRQLWAGILAQLGFIEAHREEWRVFVRGAIARGGRSGMALAKARQRLTRLLADLIAQAIATAGRPQPPRRELEAQAHALQGAVEQIANWWEQNSGEPLELVALRVMNFAWQGFERMLEGELWAPGEPA